MLFAINNREELDKIEELVSLQKQMKAVKLQLKLGEQKFYEHMKKLIEPVTKSLENASKDISKARTATSK